MAASESFVFSVLLVALTFTITVAEPALGENGGSATEASDSAFGVQLEQLKSKIAALELSIGERNRELSEKEESIKEMQKIIQDKSDSIASLQSEMELVQESLYGKEHMSKSDKQAGELEKQVERLRKDIDVQNKKMEGLGGRAYLAEKKIHELNSKLEKLHKVNDEQESRIRKTERLLQVAEEELMKAEVDSALKSEGLNRVHGELLPHWLSVHLGHFQLYIEAYWNKCGKPAADISLQKAVEMIAQVDSWIKPQIEMIKMDWIPIFKEQWLVFVAYLKPRVQLTVDMYYASKSYIAPRAVKFLNDVGSYTQEAKNLTESYMYHIAIVTRSHLDKMYVVLKPYTVKALHACRSFMTFSALYHRQVQEMLKNNELIRPVANMELAWFVATALLALPALFLFRLFSAFFRKKTKKQIHNSNTNRIRCRPKQAHPDK